MNSKTFRLGLLGGLSILAIGCGDDDGGTECGAGTVLQNGQCVPQTDTNVSPDVPDTFVPTDSTTSDADATTPDTFVPNDTTTNPDTTVTQANTGSLQPLPFGDCTNESNVNRDVSAACTMGCQCDQAKGLECMNIPYFLPGLSLCTRLPSSAGEAVGLRPANGYYSPALPSACFGNTPQSQRQQFYVKGCASLDDCKALFSGYTHCGTAGLPHHQSGQTGTECKNNSGGSSSGTLYSQRFCVIEGTFPF